MRLRARQSGRQGILPFVFEVGDREEVTARAGLPLVAETMLALGMDKTAREELPSLKRQSGSGVDEKLQALITLIAAGGDRIEDIRILGEDQGLQRLLGRPFPSPDTLLDFLGQFHDPTCWADRPPDKKAYVPPESAGLRGLEAVNRAVVVRGADRQTRTATIDHDGPSSSRTSATRQSRTRGPEVTNHWSPSGPRSN